MYHQQLGAFLFSILFICSAIAQTDAPEKLKNVDHFYEQSQKMLKELKPKEKIKKKAQELLKLKAEFQAAIKEYKKQNSSEDSTEEEDKVSFLYFTMEPTFNLAEKSKITIEDCSHTESEIKVGDSMGRGEDTSTTPQAAEALAWLKVLCD